MSMICGRPQGGLGSCVRMWTEERGPSHKQMTPKLTRTVSSSRPIHREQPGCHTDSSNSVHWRRSPRSYRATSCSPVCNT